MSEEFKERTKEFAHRCVKLAMALPKTPLGNHIRGQLIRCSTSVASNYRAACPARSRAGFISKISILIEEADESFFGLEFIIDENMVKKILLILCSKKRTSLPRFLLHRGKRLEKNDECRLTNGECWMSLAQALAPRVAPAME
jgi:four helix bundle protein